jgi:hypothetical protein
MRDYLIAFQKLGDAGRWDDFRCRIDPVLLRKWGEIMIDCRRNGFKAPEASRDGIVWMQVIATRGETTNDRCPDCDRYCRIKNFIQSGELKRLQMNNPQYPEPKKCWEKPYA